MFFRFAPMGKVEKTRFEQNYTTFVNPALCAALKSPPKMVVWNQNFKIRFLGCFFVSPRWGKSKKRVLNKIIRPSSTRLYALLVKAHAKWCYETKVAKFDSQGVFSFRPDGESRKNAFWTTLYDLRQLDFMRCLEKPTQNGGMKPNLQNSILRVFFRFAPMGKVEKTRFEQNYTTFVNPALCAAWKSPPKMVVWNQSWEIRFPGCFFVSPRWGKSKKCVLNKIIRPSSTRLYALLLKAHPKKWYETEILKFDSQGVFNKIIRPSSTRLYALLGKAHPKWWYETEILKFDSQGFFFVSPRWRKSKKRVLNKIIRLSSTRLNALLGKVHPKWWYETEIVKFDS